MIVTGRFLTASPEETEALGRRVGESVEGRTVLLLAGDLGAGKTLFTRGLAAGLGIDPDEVSSPTFSLVNRYDGGRLPLYHLDLYRLEQSQLGSTGWEDALEAGGVTLIEWPDRAGDQLPADRVDVRLSHVAETKRKVTIEATGPRSRRLLDALRDDAFGERTP